MRGGWAFEGASPDLEKLSGATADLQIIADEVYIREP
jgi:hypothetical protein